MSITNKGQRILRLLPGSAFLFVCGRCFGWSIPSTFLLLFLSFSSQLTFCVHSYPTPTTSSNSITNNNTNPPTPPLYSNEAPVRDHHVDPKIVIAVAVSALFFILFLIFVMGFFTKLFRIKKLRRRSTNQVGVVVDQNTKDDDDCSVKKYSWDDIERFTKNFSQVIGSGGFSNVYLAQLPNLNHAAVKVLIGSDRLNRVFNQELGILFCLAQDNIIKLFGYCDERDEGALVFEYVPNGTLQDKLHGRREEKETVLTWRSRLTIAFQLAQAIDYLHEKCTLHIVHGDIKASNILLDDHLNCKLCDFGSARMGFSSTVLPPSCSSSSPSPSPSIVKQVMIGSPGYTDPHYLRTGIASTKNDVYSFGVIILELVMGMEAFCPERGQLLTSIAAPLLKDVTECEAIQIAEMVDPRLAGDFDLEEARVMLSISALCLRQSPILRPSATQILQTMKDKVSSIYSLYSSQKDSTSPNSNAIIQVKI